ncbi:isopentenyldiphosphate isomerase [Aquimarina sp. EL_43]|uniref:NUDIX hydrolase n=1 Tax=Aquimarina TaxID=290174 RepID=UPI00046F045C|nr:MULTISPECIES: NUDIX domain-containing protein [Aquimarina]MBG6130694.1 isopentenyldiphosphate isomerase [Aquimarina sp. EL_35]MBG6151160.1 isopentenyldiphosphate isomerase [Aquimarina sp. EL_32]MBG6169096.1 isopentenyldiphosphate isomerase [Aquimarina sp. EL_43]
MEKWDIYDKNRIKTNKVVKRDASFSFNEFHLVIHVCIINSNNQLLIQQRQSFKKGWSNMWDLTVGGSVHSGENSYNAAEREVFEEIGYTVDLSFVRPTFTINFERGFDDYYIIIADIDISKLKLQKSEVKNVKWAGKDEIIRMIRNKEFIPYHISLIEMIFDMKNGYSVHSNNF